MTFPHINHPDEGIPIPTPPWAEEMIELLKHQVAAQNQTNQLLQDINDGLIRKSTALDINTVLGGRHDR